MGGAVAGRVRGAGASLAFCAAPLGPAEPVSPNLPATALEAVRLLLPSSLSAHTHFRVTVRQRRWCGDRVGRLRGVEMEGEHFVMGFTLGHLWPISQ